MAREPDVTLLMTASSSLDYFINTVVTIETFSVISIYPTTKPSATPCSTRSCINSKKHVIKEKIQTFTLFEIVDLIKNAHVSYIKC